MPSLNRIEYYRCERCHKQQEDHKDGMCPNGKGNFERRERRRIAASQSFTEGEVGALSAVLELLRSGGKPADLAVLMRHPTFRAVEGKIGRMKQRVALLKMAGTQTK